MRAITTGVDWFSWKVDQSGPRKAVGESLKGNNPHIFLALEEYHQKDRVIYLSVHAVAVVRQYFANLA